MNGEKSGPDIPHQKELSDLGTLTAIDRCGAVQVAKVRSVNFQGPLQESGSCSVPALIRIQYAVLLIW